MKDFLDVEIEVGDEVVYPGRCSSHLWLVHAKVIWVEEEAKRFLVERLKSWMNIRTAGAWVRRPERCVVVKKHT